MYVTYELDQHTAGGTTASFPKIKCVYIAGNVKHWAVGEFAKRTGRKVHGVRIEYEQSRRAYKREGYRAMRNGQAVDVRPSGVGATAQRFTQIVELPRHTHNVEFHTSRKELPERYQHALQRVP
jgi:hypothetical protein